MAENDSTPAPRRDKPNPPPAIFRRGEMYLLADVRDWFSEETINAWRERFPRLVRQPQTKRAFIIGDDLFTVFETWEDPDP